MEPEIPEEFARGQLQSEDDIQAGCPKLYRQTRGSWGKRLASLMTERFGVTVEHISDITWPAQKSYRAGYNQTTLDYVKTKFGAGCFDAVMEEVRQFRVALYRGDFDAGSEGLA